MVRVLARLLAWVLIGGTVLVLALLFLAPPLQPCLPGITLAGQPAVDWCGPSRPAWLASLSAIERFEVDHQALMPAMILGSPFLTIATCESLWRLLRRRVPDANGA